MSIIKVKTGGITADAITDALIADDVVGTEHLTANEVDTTALGADAVTGAQLADDAVNSEHYTDGSVDTAHIADVNVTQAKIADQAINEAKMQISNGPTNGYALTAQSGNTGGMTWAEVDTTIANDAIDSQHIAAGAVDLEHMSSESVDEDNLYISNAGSNGQFLSKQSGNNGGLTWATVSSEDYIPDGSVMVFFQANAPTGWTKVTTQNDKTLRVVSGTGGGTGGDWAMSAGETTSSHGGHAHSSAAHTHAGGNLAAGAHTLSTSEIPSHSHGGVATGGNHGGNLFEQATAAGWQTANPFVGSVNTGNSGNAGGGGSHQHSLSGTSASTTPGDTGSAGSHTHTIAAPQYIDVIICSKDA